MRKAPRTVSMMTPHSEDYLSNRMLNASLCLCVCGGLNARVGSYIYIYTYIYIYIYLFI